MNIGLPEYCWRTPFYLRCREKSEAFERKAGLPEVMKSDPRLSKSDWVYALGSQ